ncbi:hypothetical protein MLD52_11245 [Puniceicoccaceae bacterium K14]|nr:hypothetical protein [Puniceicoccaceae bacterium K14]
MTTSKLILKSLLLLGIFLTALALQKVRAHEPIARSDLYVTASIGEATLDRYDREVGNGLRRYEYGLGIQFLEWFSVELTRFDTDSARIDEYSYIYLPRLADVIDTYQYPYYGSYNTLEIDGYALVAKLRYEINEFVSFYTKQGVARNSVTTRYGYGWSDAYNPTYPVTSEHVETDLRYRVSIGASFRIERIEGVEAFLEWTRDDGEYVVGESVNAGMTYRF